MNFEIILATNNKHKLQEVREILSPHKIVVYGLNDLNLHPDDVVENGANYYENALIKAESVAKLTSMPIIADDSGLEILALNNEPGLYSARYAKQLGGHENAFKDIFSRLKDLDRSARFVCNIVLLNVSKTPLRFEGIVEGKIATTTNGESGFGYDPIFIESSTGLTYASMSKEQKNKLSHRGKALIKLLTYLRINQSIK